MGENFAPPKQGWKDLNKPGVTEMYPPTSRLQVKSKYEKSAKTSDCHALILLKPAHLSEFTMNQVMMGKNSGLLLRERH